MTAAAAPLAPAAPSSYPPQLQPRPRLGPAPGWSETARAASREAVGDTQLPREAWVRLMVMFLEPGFAAFLRARLVRAMELERGAGRLTVDAVQPAAKRALDSVIDALCDVAVYSYLPPPPPAADL